jgi:hypothetical protein
VNFLRRLFRREPPPRPLIDRRCMNEDWTRGDLALCISDNWLGGPTQSPHEGLIYRVTDVGEGFFIPPHDNILAYGLAFAELPEAYWQSTSFRKVRPDHSAADEEFAREMKRLRRKVHA